MLTNLGSLDMPIELAFGFFCICDWRRCCNSVFFRLLAGPNEETGKIIWQATSQRMLSFVIIGFIDLIMPEIDPF